VGAVTSVDAIVAGVSVEDTSETCASNIALTFASNAVKSPSSVAISAFTFSHNVILILLKWQRVEKMFQGEIGGDYNGGADHKRPYQASA
jgi:precorrin-4 methylase